MKNAVLTLALALAVTTAVAHAAERQPTIKLTPDVERVLRDYENGWKARDAAALAALFTDDGFVLSNGRPAARGRAAIEKAYKGAGGPLFLRPIAFEHDDTRGWLIGTFAEGEGPSEPGKFILLLRREGDRWMIAADMDNLNAFPPRPPAPAAAAPPAN